MKRISVKTLTKLAVVAALYVALTVALQPLSYGSIQFRISEALMLLVVYNPVYSIALTIGCLVANFASSLGLVDVIFGTLATLVSCLAMMKIKNIYIASLIPAIANGIVVGLELHFIYDLPLIISAIYVFLGEFVVCTLIGIPLFKSFESNEALMDRLELKPLMKNESIISRILDKYTSFSLAIVIISIVLFFNLGLYTIDADGNLNRYTLFVYASRGFDLDNAYPLLYIILVLPFIALVLGRAIKGIPSFVITSILSFAGIALLIYAITISNKTVEWYFYSYFVVFISLIVVAVFRLRKQINNHKSDII